MGSVSEPLRPAYVAGRPVKAGMNSDAAVATAGKKTSQKKKTRSSSSRKQSGDGSHSGAKRLVKAAYEPFRRAVSSGSKSRGSGESGKSSSASSPRAEARPVVSAEVIDTPAAGRSSDRVASAPDKRPAASAEDIAAVIAAAANVSGGLTVASQSDTDRLRTAESMMRESLQKYQAAMRQMEVRFEVLDRDLSLKKNRNPIHHIESRIKKPASIFEKLHRKNLPVTIESMEENLHDIAGVRVICSYIQDVYNLLDLMRRQDDLDIITVKDYIADPKPNGYRSLHAIVRIPVYFMDKREMVPVEVQLRTIAMDFWASLEHSLKYKAVREVHGIDASDELKDCSRIIEDVESRMQILARALEEEDG